MSINGLITFIHEVRDPLDGLILLNEFEFLIYRHRVIQRLREIKQLGLTNLIYPSATCSRLSHSLGVLNTASVMVHYIFENNDNTPLFPNFILNTNEKSICQLIVRLLGIIHDAGIGPLSHASDNFLIKEQNHPASLEAVFKLSHSFSRLVERYLSEINQHLTTPISIDCLIKLLNKRYDPNNDLFKFLSRIIVADKNIPFDADRLDYLSRDNYYCGVQYGAFDKVRLLHQLHYYSDDAEDYFYIYPGAIPTFEQFLLSRYYLFYQVYYHKKRVIIDDLLEKVIENFLLQNSDYGTQNKFTMDDHFLSLTDSKIENYIIDNQNIDSCRILHSRNLPKCYFDFPVSTWEPQVIKTIDDEAAAEMHNNSYYLTQISQKLQLIPTNKKIKKPTAFIVKIGKQNIPFEQISLISSLCDNQEITMKRAYETF